MIRLFVALKIETEIQQKFGAVISDFKTKGGKVKWIDAKNLHITLKFLGNTDRRDVDPIISQLQDSLKNFQAIESDFNNLGGFPNLRKPKVIWTDIDKNKNAVVDLAESINESFTEINIEKNDKPFKPHLTLGRVKSYEGITSLTDYLANYKFENIPVTFNKVQLIQSTLTQQGPIYRTLEEITLSERFGH